MKATRECPICKTKKFRKTTDSGLVCKYGHKQLGIQAEQAEDDNFTGGLGARRKTVRQEVQVDVVTPAQQKSDFLLVIQYSLQVFTRCMVQELNFPPELEPTVRELWLLYISDSKKQISEAYLFEAHVKSSAEVELKRDIYEKIEQEEMTLDDYKEFDSSSEEEDTPAQPSIDPSTPRTPHRFRSTTNKWPVPVYAHTLSFIYLACIYLNYPILPVDLIRWCKSGLLPYSHMQERLPDKQLRLIGLRLLNSMWRIPASSTIIEESYTLARCFFVNCKLEFPEFNIPLYLDRFCAQFFLPVEGYFYAKMIFEKRHKVRTKITDRDPSLSTITSILMACVIEAVKLIYGVCDIKNSDCVSEFNTEMTRETWSNLIKTNIERWKKLKDDENTVENLIFLVQGASVATRLIRQKENVIISMLNRDLSPVRPSARSNVMTNSLMDSYELVDKNNTAPDDSNIIQQGEFFYRRKNGFAPTDYLNVLELACLVTGDISNDRLETALKDIDKSITHRQHRIISEKKFKQYVNPYILK